ncbi:23S rRNA (uracil(1939)-C(5))-methyltransferase RlmD [Ramlibacter sp. AN1015]|uniref:23S rRNA (uracil(1939)-C(5))-methyltransferase RlmD n=1 Tax=Ramlibacter sp. AN1015 TaxID=3133428 RepID=UPI0030BB6C42
MNDSSDKPALPEGWLAVDALDIDAQGVARREDGKVVFIEGALPGELVSARVNRRKNNWEQASLTEIHRASSQRVQGRCPHFGLHEGACGGCKMQHLDGAAQVAIKQRVLEDNLWHLGKVRAETLLRPIHGPYWGYRWRARFSVRHVRKKGTVLVGFHERKSRYVADIRECHVVPQAVSALLLPLRALVASMEAIETCPQIELACGVDARRPGEDVIALVLRHLEPLSAPDLERLRQFGRDHPAVQWWLQPKGPDTVHLLDQDDGRELAYTLPEFGITMPFRPTDFTQVNPFINQVLVGRALRLLDAQAGERVIDWFCGLGNFTLPLATRAGEVLGIEGSEALVARSRSNLERNAEAVSAPTRFAARNLFETTPQQLVADGVADKWLVDPPREGAFALAKALADLHQDPTLAPGWQPPRRIVYVSCNPATLARDAGLLVHQAGYRCTAAGVVNMFPHTAHVESMAVFERDLGA